MSPNEVVEECIIGALLINLFSCRSVHENLLLSRMIDCVLNYKIKKVNLRIKTVNIFNYLMLFNIKYTLASRN